MVRVIFWGWHPPSPPAWFYNYGKWSALFNKGINTSPEALNTFASPYMQPTAPAALGGATQATPPTMHKRSSTRAHNRRPRIRTYSRIFLCRCILPAHNHGAWPNDTHPHARAQHPPWRPRAPPATPTDRQTQPLYKTESTMQHIATLIMFCMTCPIPSSPPLGGGGRSTSLKDKKLLELLWKNKREQGFVICVS